VVFDTSDSSQIQTLINAVNNVSAGVGTGNVTIQNPYLTVEQTDGNSLHVDVDNFPNSVNTIITGVSQVIPVQIDHNLDSVTVYGTISIQDTNGSSITTTNGSLNVNITGGGGSSEVSITNFPSTQPVSIASMPTTPVTGAFYQATQPVSLTSTTITGSVAVTGSFYQNTQPISGTVAISNPVSSVSVSNFPASQAVTGTFYPQTQPVSISGSVPVTGVFYQATQPISISGALSTTESTNFSSTATQSTVSCTGTQSTQLLAANANRKGCFINTTSSHIVSINYGAAASNTTFVAVAAPISLTSGGQVWCMPYPIYQGAINVYVATTENVIVTEMT
jgi:hypothetical protein